MKCTKCGSHNVTVVSTRSTHLDTDLRRRRKCKDCGFKFTTYEITDKSNIKVIKNDKRIEPFNRQKIINGIVKSFANLNVPLEKQVQIANNVERDIYLLGKETVSSKTIGDEVLKKLKAINDVAYVRFASVYYKFKKVSEFNEFILQMK